MLECDDTHDPENPTTRMDCGIHGGWPYIAMQYVINAGGLASEKDYPFCYNFKGDAKCRPCSAKGYDPNICGPTRMPP